VAHDLLGHGDTLRAADLLGVCDGGGLVRGVAGVLEAAGDAVEEFLVLAHACDFELLAAGDLVARSPLVYTWLLEERRKSE
jgi:hypothetical protein